MTTRAILHARLHHPSIEAYREVFTAFEDITPAVQALPPDSALLDVTGALRYWQRTPTELAELLQTRILARYGLHTTIGGGSTRLLATIATQVCPPANILIIDPDPAVALHFLHRQPIGHLPGVGPALERSLHRYGLNTIGDLANLPTVTLQRITGAATARLLHDRAHNLDPRRIVPGGPPPAITAKQRFDHDVLDPATVHHALLHLAVELGARLRQSHQCARQIELQVTLADRSHLTRSRTLPEASNHTPRLQETLLALFTKLGLQRARIRALTARVASLAPSTSTAVQLTFDRAIEDARRLEPVIDRANHRWGSNTLRPATLALALAPDSHHHADDKSRRSQPPNPFNSPPHPG